jgi:hypothetical protein
MKVKITKTVTVTHEERLAIGHQMGCVDVPATRDQIAEFYIIHGFDADLEDTKRLYYAYKADQYNKLAGI